MTDPSSREKPVELVSAAIDSDAELLAIRAVLGALVPLKREGRTRVLDYVLKRIGVTASPIPPASTSPSLTRSVDAYITSTTSESRGQPNDIRSLTKEKAPRSANEMAALVAYYVTELAPEPYRKESITADDIKKYFQDAHIALPSK